MPDSEVPESGSPPVPPTNTLALVSLISGIAGWTIVPFLGGIIAVITGHLAKNEIQRSPGTATGQGLATAGLILGYISIALGICFLCLALLGPLLFGVTFFSSILRAFGTGTGS